MAVKMYRKNENGHEEEWVHPDHFYAYKKQGWVTRLKDLEPAPSDNEKIEPEIEPKHIGKNKRSKNR